MNYILILLVILPIISLTLWMSGINKKYENKIKDLRRLIYKVHDEVNQIKRSKKH